VKSIKSAVADTYKSSVCLNTANTQEGCRIPKLHPPQLPQNTR